MRRRYAFTLIEILVVIAIILLVSVVALPVVYNALSGRQVDDGARVFTGMLAGVRDAAVRHNAPRGLRLLPDADLILPAPGSKTAGSLQLAYSRMVMIEPGGDHSEGHVNIGPQYPFKSTASGGFPPPYPRGINSGDVYPFPVSGQGIPSVLMVEEAPFDGGFAWLNGGGSPNPPTNWYWNIRVGDRFRFGDSGRSYIVVGPLTNSPWTTGDNPELFVNVGAPGTASPLVRNYYLASPPPTTFSLATTYSPEFLFLVNGEDDNLDGYVDSGWDGFNNNPPSAVNPGGNGAVDELLEWEPERWVGAQASNSTLDQYPTPNGIGPSADFALGQGWVNENWQSGTHNVGYTIQRRPVPSQGAREVSLPRGIVIDATGYDAESWSSRATAAGDNALTTALFGSRPERSRIANAIQVGSLYVDIMLNPNGLVIPTTTYSAPTSTGAEPFMHFWLTNIEDVYPIGTLWGTTTTRSGQTLPKGNPGAAGSPPQVYQLPLPNDAMAGTTPGPGNYPPAGGATLPVLKHERRLVTLFSQSGMAVTNSIETAPAPIPAGATTSLLPPEGFNTSDVNQPYYRAQLGQKEAK